MSSDQVAAIGAFLSGVGSVLSALWYARRMRRQAKADCDQRLAEFKQALHEGVDIARHDEAPE